MTLAALEPGRRFRSGSGKTGTLVYCSSFGAAVHWDGSAKARRFTDHRTGKLVQFKERPKLDHIAAGTEVEAL
jgi:hypothetical protein